MTVPIAYSGEANKLIDSMSETLQLTLRSTIFDRVRQLIIDKDFMEFENKDSIFDSRTRFLKSDIKDFRFGVKWINGFKFVIGRIYCVDVRSKTGNILKIRLRSIYGIHKKQLTNKYAQIVQAIHDHFFDDISSDYLIQFSEHKDFQLLGITFNQTGLCLDSKSIEIPWEDIGTKSYQTYYAVFQKSMPDKYKAFEYLYDWNTSVLYSVSRQILKNKGLWSD